MGVKRMMTKAENKVSSVVNYIVTKAENFASFGKFERITAGFCMAIPFFLMITDLPNGWLKYVYFLLPIAIVVVPQRIRLKKQDKDGSGDNYGRNIAVRGGFILFILYVLFTQVMKIQSRPSISAYVEMNDAHVFGMLLAIAAMLLMASGVVFWNKKISFREGTWRSWLNVILGLLLLGIVVFPCTTRPTIHGIVAIFFFVGCAAGTIRRDAKEGKEVPHRWVDYGSVGAMALFALIYFANAYEWFGCIICFWPLNLVNLFGVESIALWIVGLDFILVSLKRKLADYGGAQHPNPTPETLQQLLDGGAKLKH
ncbi:MAG TPA: hypothetical protein VK589_29305 [Chryseolinea sp.]|nr:hypothetical protein [Chryseolinea sp.]